MKIEDLLYWIYSMEIESLFVEDGFEMDMYEYMLNLREIIVLDF